MFTLLFCVLAVVIGVNNGFETSKARIYIKEAKDLLDEDPYYIQYESDPYVYSYAYSKGGHEDEYKTDYVNSDNSPEWHETFSFNERDDYEKVYFKLYDDDYGEDDFLGETKYVYLKDLDCDKWNDLTMTVYKNDDYNTNDIQGSLLVSIEPYDCN